MQQRDQALLVRMQEAVVPRPPEALGQDVLQQQVAEVGTGLRVDLRWAAQTVAVAEADLAALHEWVPIRSLKYAVSCASVSASMR